MSEQNLELMRRACDTYNRGDLEAFAEMLDPDVLWKPDPSWPEVRARSGREEVLQLLADIREPLDSNEVIFEKLVDGGDLVVGLQVWRGVPKGTDDEVEGALGVIVTRFSAGRDCSERGPAPLTAAPRGDQPSAAEAGAAPLSTIAACRPSDAAVTLGCDCGKAAPRRPGWSRPATG